MDIKIGKSKLKRIGTILLAVLIVLLCIWLGFSFFSMKSSSPHLKTSINLKNDELNKKVIPVSSVKDNKYLEYKYDVILYEISFEKEQYVIYGYARNFLEDYEDIENAKFVYSLDRADGEFDFSTVEEEDSVSLKFEYRVDRDLRYFLEYSVCTIKKIHSDIWNINSQYSQGYCPINRQPYKWSVELVEIEDKE